MAVRSIGTALMLAVLGTCDSVRYTNSSTVTSSSLRTADLILQGIGESVETASPKRGTSSTVVASTTLASPIALTSSTRESTTVSNIPITSTPDTISSTLIFATSISQQNATVIASATGIATSPSLGPTACAPTHNASFNLDVELADTSKNRRFAKRQSPLVLTIQDGRLVSTANLTGYFTAAGVFSFDASLPADARHLDDWCLTPEDLLTAGGQTVFYYTGNGIQDHQSSSADTPVHISVVPYEFVTTSTAASPSSESIALNSTVYAGGSGSSIPAVTTAQPLNSTTVAGNSSDPLSQCIAKIHAWSSQSSAWFQTVGNNLISYSISLSSTSFPGKVSYPTGAYTTLCDGHARISGKPITETTTTTFTTTITQMPNYTLGRPTCELNGAECSDFWTTWSSCSNSSLYFAPAYQPVTMGVCADFLGSTLCPDIVPKPTSAAANNGFCAIQVDGVRLHYWPVRTVNGDLCNNTGTTIKPSGPPPVATIGSITITSPMIAVEIDSLSLGVQGLTQYANVSTAKSMVTITMPEDELRSGVPAPHIVLNSISFNYNDLNPGQIPWTAWTRQGQWVQHCNGYSLTRTDIPPYCNTVFVDNYSPVLAYMTQLADLDPGWKGCFPLFGLWDPPTVLTPVNALGPSTAVPSPTSAVIPKTSTVDPAPATTPAAPAQTRPSAVSGSTASSEPTRTSANVKSSSNNPGTTPQAPTPIQTSAIIDPQDITKSSGGASPQSQGSRISPPASGNSGVADPGSVPTSQWSMTAPAVPKPASSVTLIDGSTLQPGSPPLVVGSSTFSALPGTSGVQVIGGGRTSTIILVAADTNDPSGPSVIAVGSGGAQTSATVIAGQTLQPGSAPIIVDSSTFSALPGTSGVQIVAAGRTTTVLPTPASSNNPPADSLDPSIVVIGTAGALSQGHVTVIAGQTLSAESAPVIIGDTTFSALSGSSGIAVIANGRTSTVVPSIAGTGGGVNAIVPSVVAVDAPGKDPKESLVTIPGLSGSGGILTLPSNHVITVAPGSIAAGVTAMLGPGGLVTASAIPDGFVLDGQTIRQGQPARTIGNSVLTVNSAGQLVAEVANTIMTGSVPGVLIVDGTMLQANQPPETIGGIAYSIDSQGRLLEISGSSTITMAPGNSEFVVDGTTLARGFAPVTINDEIFGINDQEQLIGKHTTILLDDPAVRSLVIDGTTMIAGGTARTIDGAVLSVNSAGQLVQITGGSLDPELVGAADLAAMIAEMAGSGSGADVEGESQMKPAATTTSADRNDLTGPTPGGTTFQSALATTTASGVASTHHALLHLCWPFTIAAAALFV